jgi:hypothetical protein
MAFLTAVAGLPHNLGLMPPAANEDRLALPNKTFNLCHRLASNIGIRLGDGIFDRKCTVFSGR